MFSKLGDITTGLDKLNRDLKSGAWRRRYGNLLDKTELDLGYRMIVTT